MNFSDFQKANSDHTNTGLCPHPSVTIVCLHWGKVSQGSGFFQQQAASQTQKNCFKPFHSNQPKVLYLSNNPSVPNCPDQATRTQFPRKMKPLGQEESCVLELRETKSRKEETVCNFLFPSYNLHSHIVFFMSTDHPLVNTNATLKAVLV